MLFQKIGDDEQFEVSNYVKEYLKLNSQYNIDLYLGCDS